MCESCLMDVMILVASIKQDFLFKNCKRNQKDVTNLKMED